ncbi:ClpXP adapter SpxH family protein [Emticicia soli]|uniref:ClpXP adapter SpxH family protein n=1 Tax=Emticicia soli TaxID=2027878 RepID=A0ABW5J804_9BACT
MQETNPLLCDIETGMCITDAPEGSTTVVETEIKEKPIRIVYYTDPICSTCWGIEPQLRKLKLEYGQYIAVEYHMGGLLKDWSYNSGGISKPSDVAHHWDEVSQHYQMPIDGDVWLEDPLDSSYPPSVAFMAAQLQDPAKALLFLRRIREMVFLEKKNITRWEHLSKAAAEVGLDVNQLKVDYEGRGAEAFKEDLALGKMMGVRGFPTLFFYDRNHNQQYLYGLKPYAEFESKILALIPGAQKQSYSTDWEYLFSHFATLCTKEYAVLSNKSMQEAEAELEGLYQQNVIQKSTSKNGNIWKKKN